MMLRFQNFLTAFLMARSLSVLGSLRAGCVLIFAVLSLFWVQSVVQQNPASGGYQLFEPSAFANIADNPLNAIEKFSASLENAPDYANAHGFTSDGYVRYDTDGDGVWDTPCEIAFNFWDFNWLLGSAAYACPDGTKPTSSNDNPPATNSVPSPIDNPQNLVGFRRDHIMNRHGPGSGKSGKTEFPANWDYG